MIALVAGNNVEHHTPELLLHVEHGQMQSFDHLQHLFVAVGAHQIVILMRQSVQGLHVQFVTIVETIKTLSHEMTALFFFLRRTHLWAFYQQKFYSPHATAA